MRHDFASLEGHKDNVGQHMDDFWMAIKNDKEGRALHIQMIHEFLDLCKKHSYFLKLSKCKIMIPSITLLGWHVTGEGLQINPTKVTGISEWPCTLKSVKDV